MTIGGVAELGEGRLQIDLGFRDREGLIAAYLIPGPDGWTLIETGPGSTRAALVRGVGHAGVAPEEVVRIFVTHIHLDHSGGLGHAAQAFPNARLLAHSEGVAHLVDPTRLVASARRAWGPAGDAMFGPTGPVPADRLEPLRGGERFPVSGGSLSVLATPGHARHHLSFLDEPSRALYVGDSAGVRLRTKTIARPAVPPPDLDVEQLLESLERMRSFRPNTLRYAHFGEYPSADASLDRYGQEVLRWKDRALSAALSDPTVDAIAAALRALSHEEGPTAGVPDDDELVSGIEMAAMGLLRYLRRTGQIPE